MCAVAAIDARYSANSIVRLQAYFHHLDDFLRFEDATQLYQRFTLFSLTFNLITTKLILIPSDKFPLLQLCLLAVDPLSALGD